MPSTEFHLEPEHQSILRDIALESIEYGLDHGRKRLKLDLPRFPQALTQEAATFVTLHIDDELKGCIGHLQAFQPLVQDVAANAHSSAYEDTRFDPVTWADLPRLDVSISILSPPVELKVVSEQDLLEKLQPGKDGLIVQEKGKRATFLPSVWDMFDSPQSFVNQLKQKAGLPAHYWSDSLQFERYTTISI